MVLASDRNNTGFVDPMIVDPVLGLSLFHVSFGFLGTEKYHSCNCTFYKENGGNIMNRGSYFQTIINKHVRSLFPMLFLTEQTLNPLGQYLYS